MDFMQGFTHLDLSIFPQRERERNEGRGRERNEGRKRESRYERKKSLPIQPPDSICHFSCTLLIPSLINRILIGRILMSHSHPFKSFLSLVSFISIEKYRPIEWME